MALPLFCIFCAGQLDESTSPEHIIGSALGGRLAPTTIVCTNCNRELGRQVDEPLADDTQQIRHSLRIRRGDGDPPPAIRVDSEHGPVILRPHGSAQPAQSKADATLVDDRLEISVVGKDEKTVVDRMAHKLRQLGVKSVDDIEQRLSFATFYDSNKPFNDAVMLKGSIGGDQHFRAIAKAAFELLGLRQRAAVHDSRFDEARHFVRYGVASNCTMWDFTHTQQLPFGDAALGPVYHSILVWAHPGQPVIGAVTLFGKLPFTIRLSNKWWSDAFAVAHAVNPTDGRNLGIVDMTPPPAISLEALDRRAPDSEAVRLAAMHWYKVGRERQLDAWRRSVIEEAMEPFQERIAAMGGVDKATAKEIGERVAWAWVTRNHGKETQLDEREFLRKVKARFLELQTEDEMKKGRKP